MSEVDFCQLRHFCRHGERRSEALADEIFDAEGGLRRRGLAFGQIARNVFAKNVSFKVHGVADSTVGDVGVLIGVGDDGDFCNGLLPAGNSKADTVNGDRTFADDVGREGSWDLHAEIQRFAVPSKMGDPARDVYVAEDEVPAEFFSRGKGLFEIYASSSSQKREGSLSDGFERQVGGEVFVVEVDDGEAAAVNGDAGGQGEFVG